MVLQKLLPHGKPAITFGLDLCQNVLTALAVLDLFQSLHQARLDVILIVLKLDLFSQ